MTELLNASYILDGVPMPLSPAKMLRECTVEPPLEPDGDPATLADEHLDQVPGNCRILYCRKGGPGAPGRHMAQRPFQDGRPNA